MTWFDRFATHVAIWLMSFLEMRYADVVLDKSGTRVVALAFAIDEDAMDIAYPVREGESVSEFCSSP
jgi:hypothetical protein